MKNHSGHNHQRSSRPDQKMGRQESKRVGPGPMNRMVGTIIDGPTTVQRQIVQNLANRKRRQRDKMPL